MNQEEKAKLLDALTRAGWTTQGNSIYAPNETIWFDRENPWAGDLRQFRDRMVARARRIKNNIGALGGAHDKDHEASLTDILGLVEVLNRLV